MKATVSVVLPSYNHEAHVAEAIDSVLAQTYADFELLISDDASPDHTFDIIRQYRDPRIGLVHRFEHNVGAGINGRYLLERCTGEYVALINSDDVWMPDRLEKGVAYMQSHPECGAVFSWASLIDEDGRTIVADCDVFHQPNRTRAEWLYTFFTQANCLCHPSMLIRREVYQKLGYYRLGMRQLPDFDMWIRVATHYDIHVLQEVLVKHRRFIHSDKNTSAPVQDNSIRDVNESLYILTRFVERLPDGLFCEAFRRVFRNKSASTPEQLICERFFLLEDGHYYLGGIGHLAAMQYYIEHCDTLSIQRVLLEEYGYCVNDFYAVGTKNDLLGLRRSPQVSDGETLYGSRQRIKRLLRDTPFYPALKKMHTWIKEIRK